MNGEEDTIPFLKEALAEKKEQLMCQHFFQHLVESTQDFRC